MSVGARYRAPARPEGRAGGDQRDHARRMRTGAWGGWARHIRSPEPPPIHNIDRWWCREALLSKTFLSH